MIDAVDQRNWDAYLMEATGLAGFVLFAGLLTIFFEHPDQMVMQTGLKNHPILRRLPLGIILGAYTSGTTALVGKRSGAHINPVVTWSFFRLGKISLENAVFYSLAQFAGAVAASQILKHFEKDYFSSPFVNFGITKPTPPFGTLSALTAEFAISFLMMIVILFAGSSKRYKKYIPVISGFLITSFIIFEMPFSGMSMNPARSFAAALAANQWNHLWIYFVAPATGMIFAEEIFSQWKNSPGKQEENKYADIPYYPLKRAK